MTDDAGYVTINGRMYPSACPPGSHWALDEAWGILDSIKDGAISDDIRVYLAGMIVGTLTRLCPPPAKRTAGAKDKSS